MTRAGNQASVGGGGTPVPQVDFVLVLAAGTLLGLGLIMVASASLHRIEAAPFYYVSRQIRSSEVVAVCCFSSHVRHRLAKSSKAISSSASSISPLRAA